MKKSLLLSLPFAFLLNPMDAYAGKKHHRKQPKKPLISTQSNTTPNATATSNNSSVQASSPIVASPTPTAETASADVKVSSTEGTMLGAPAASSSANAENRASAAIIPSSSTSSTQAEADALAVLNNSSWFGATLANLSYFFTASTNTEKVKFPDISIDQVLKFLQPGKGWKSILGQYIEFTTGSKEDRRNYYKGSIIFTNLDYGSLQTEIDEKTLTVKPAISMTSMRESMDAHSFISNLKTTHGTSLKFIKGDPIKDANGNTTLEYHCYGNPLHDRGIKVTVVRHSEEKFKLIKASLPPVHNQKDLQIEN